MKTIILFFLITVGCFAQNVDDAYFGPPPTANVTPATMKLPKFFMSFGGGFSQYTDPKTVVTLGGGVLVGAGIYTTLHLDESLKYNPATAKYEPYSVVRAGAHRALLQVGRLTFAGSGNFGASSGADALTGSASLAGMVLIDVRPSTALYFGTTVTREPSITKTGFVYGVVYKIF